jgi:hypothetical protein
MRRACRTATGVLAVLLAAGALAPPPAPAGHEFPFYPSYYPQEITVTVLPPAAAAPKLGDASLLAYVGGDPFAGAPVPPTVTHAESLGAYVVVTLNPAAPWFPDAGRRCRAARAVAARLALRPGFTRHPYAVTPYHPDYLQHADRAQAAAAAGDAPWDGPPLRVRAGDPAAQRLLGAAPADADAWDATIETVEVASLWTAAAVGPYGLPGPDWVKAGWSHAYRLMRDAMADREAQERADALHARLTGAVGDPAERFTLERRLVETLGAGCERTVAGYTLRAEPLNVDYSAGVENVARDAQAGLESAAFPRTVKLKDFPWNGWLTVGVPATPAAAWNPVAGFGDPAGRLIWHALGDPAFFPSPHGSGWVPNRLVVAATELGTPAVAVPAEALAPAPGTGVLTRVGPGRQAAARVLYRVLGSRFHDGTKLEVADLHYALGVAARVADPAVRAATARLRERLVGLRVLRVETDVLAFGEDKLTYEVPIVEVFVDGVGGDPGAAALVAPPWTTVPWHVLALAEAAVDRGLAAFSAGAARARGVPWLDLVRDARVGRALGALLDEWAQRSHVPPPLAGLVTPAEARARWSALRAFRDANGHLLATNGPYRLARWSEDATVLQVFRDLSYPRGVGVFNSLATPLRAWVTAAERQGDALVVRGDIERVERFGRDLRVVREPFVKREVEQDRRALPVARYVAVGPDGTVAAAGSVAAEDPGRYRIDLARLDRPGRHVVLVALTVDDARTGLPVTVVPWTR